MAGHSKWANIKHRKARQDAVRGKAWSKCSKAIIVAAKNGSDPEQNLGLRYAIEEARAANMPKDTIEKAIKKGSGKLEDGESYTEARYEGYGPNGVAMMVDCLTDNINRTAPEIKKIFERSGGKLGVAGSVAFGFTQRGLITIEQTKISEEDLMEIALDAGAEDIQPAGEVWEIMTEPKDFPSVKQAIEEKGHTVNSAQVTMIPSNTVECVGNAVEKVLRLMENLEDHDDVQKVYANFDISDEELTRLNT